MCVFCCVMGSTLGCIPANEVNSVKQKETRLNGLKLALIGWRVFAGPILSDPVHCDKI